MKKKSLLAATLLASQLVMSAVSAQEETTLPPEVSISETSEKTTVSETTTLEEEVITTSEMSTADTTSEMPTSLEDKKEEPKTEDKVETFQFRIGVMVDNSAVEEGIKGATVIIKDSNGKQIGSFKTGASGYITLSARKGAKLTYELADFPAGYEIVKGEAVSYQTTRTFEVGERFGETYRISLRKLDTTTPAPAENKPEVKPEDKQDVPDNSKEGTVAKEVDNKKDDKKEAEKSDSDVRKELLATIDASKLSDKQKEELAVEVSMAEKREDLAKLAMKVKEMTQVSETTQISETTVAPKADTKQEETRKVEVKKEEAKQAALPKTGEATSFAALALAVLSVVAGALLVAPRFKKQK
ncbi:MULTISPECIES: LPXTG cell wall anchor domain-containing protein [unclassified Facklamia]|uniref:LPXTG cell wall anchor domain-containing protein n=1 Tax=Aerococcaceae TaxID=186827 RepID=UPI0013BC8136|nr:MULTISPECIES: LPXTG cell wall anchor domain-containing protein [unclassified Facklamia]NEW63659.1 LPXTG cell wall anchor domain-containing protein [Facklamia sp. 252]NEW67130.1 LPXTG cell wall anchor domain-containing protein [Facklamia sp. 253]QQD66327.1 LPXTG cell wall anchor domain-containing protein [Aerococcaceae bacterium zg-252]